MVDTRELLKLLVAASKTGSGLPKETLIDELQILGVLKEDAERIAGRVCDRPLLYTVRVLDDYYEDPNYEVPYVVGPAGHHANIAREIADDYRDDLDGRGHFTAADGSVDPDMLPHRFRVEVSGYPLERPDDPLRFVGEQEELHYVMYDTKYPTRRFNCVITSPETVTVEEKTK